MFDVLGSWLELKELALVGFAIGGWDLLVRGRGRVPLRWVGLGVIDLLDGTFTHREGAVFRPDGPSPLLISMYPTELSPPTRVLRCAR